MKIDFYRSANKLTMSAAAGLNYFASYIALPMLGIIVVASVIWRYFINKPLVWAPEVIGLLLLIVMVGPIVSIWNDGRHLKMDIVYDHLTPRMQKFATMISVLVVFLFSTFALYQSYSEFGYAVETQSGSEMLYIPEWPFWLFIVIVISILCAQAIFRVIQLITDKT